MVGGIHGEELGCVAAFRRVRALPTPGAIEPAWAILNHAVGQTAQVPAKFANLSKCTQAGSIVVCLAQRALMLAGTFVVSRMPPALSAPLLTLVIAHLP